MKNFNRIALATALTISGGSGIVHASDLGEKQINESVDYYPPYETEVGRVTLSNNLEMAHLKIPDNEPRLTADMVFDEPQAAVPKETAVRIGNPVQLSEPPPPPPPPPPVEPVPIPNFSNWLRLAECESGGYWQINTGNGYYGGLQFNLTSWRAVGGLLFAARPDLATVEQQMIAAESLLDIQGWGAWPGCTRELDIRN